MALTREQALSQYGTEAYTGWGEVEAAADARAKGITAPSSGGGGFNFDWAAQTDKAYEDLGAYYNRILDESNGDINIALSRLQEDYTTGKRYREQDYQLSNEARQLAQQGLSANATELLNANQRNLLRRGVSRQSAFDPTGGIGIGDVQTQKVQQDINRAQEQMDLGNKQTDITFERAGQTADLALARGQEDLQRQKERTALELERQRKLEANQLATTRAQRAFQRFESGLV